MKMPFDQKFNKQQVTHDNGEIKNISRRSFVKTLGLTGGSLVLSVQFTSGCAADNKPLDKSSENKSFSPDVFLSIAPDGQVTIICHRSEMGQGIRSTLPLLVADELEADWARVTVEQGLGDAKYGSQNTDGSRSVRKNYLKLKQAGAMARTMLAQAAAQVWNIPVAQVTIQNHQALRQNSEETLNFSQLVAIAATFDLPERESLKLKTESEQRYIGKEDIKLLDGFKIVTGDTTFGFDVKLPGMKIALIKRPPVVFGKVKSFDATETLKIKGVVKVVELPALTPPAPPTPPGLPRD